MAIVKKNIKSRKFKNKNSKINKNKLRRQNNVRKSKKINRKMTKLRGGSGILSRFFKKSPQKETHKIFTEGEVRENPLFINEDRGESETEYPSRDLLFRPSPNLPGYSGESQKIDLITKNQIKAIKKLYNFLGTIATNYKISLSTAHTKIMLLYMYLYNIYVKDENALDEDKDKDKDKIIIEDLIDTKLYNHVYGNKYLMKQAFSVFIKFINSIRNIDNEELKVIINEKNNVKVINNLINSLKTIENNFTSYTDSLYDSLHHVYGRKQIFLLLSDKYDESKFKSFADKIKEIYDDTSNLRPGVDLRNLVNPFEDYTTV